MDDGGLGRVEPGVWERAEALTGAAFGAAFRVIRSTRNVGLSAILSAGVIAAVWPSTEVALVLALGIALAFALLGAASFRDARLRSAVELYLDHDLIEGAVWQRETGSRRPRRRAEIERWLREHPVGPGRISMLVLLGRFEEADRELARRPVSSLDEQFAVESDRQYRVMYTDGMPDLADLRVAWDRLTDPAQRHRRRECLALQEAQVAATEGRDPMAVLADAVPEVGRIQVRCRAWFLVANLSGATVALAVCIRILRATIAPG